MMLPRGVSFFHDVRQWLGGWRFDVIFDVGANVGQSAHVFAEENPQAQIYCFEPVARAHEELMRNVSYLPKVSTFQLAMGASVGRGIIHVGKETSLASMEKRAPDDREEFVDVTTVDAVCAGHGIKSIDLLKVDAEGHDLAVLQGARDMLGKGAVSFVQVEASFYAGDPRFVCLDRAVAMLNDLGYEVFGIYDQMPHPTGRPSVAYFNAVFVNRKLLKEPAWR